MPHDLFSMNLRGAHDGAKTHAGPGVTAKRSEGWRRTAALGCASYAVFRRATKLSAKAKQNGRIGRVARQCRPMSMPDNCLRSRSRDRSDNQPARHCDRGRLSRRSPPQQGFRKRGFVATEHDCASGRESLARRSPIAAINLVRKTTALSLAGKVAFLSYHIRSMSPPDMLHCHAIQA